MKTKKFFKIGRSGQIQAIDNIKDTGVKKTEKPLDANIFNVGYYLLTPILIGVFLGLLIDGKLGTKPIFTLLFIIFGVVSSFYNLWKLSKIN